MIQLELFGSTNPSEEPSEGSHPRLKLPLLPDIPEPSCECSSEKTLRKCKCYLMGIYDAWALMAM